MPFEASSGEHALVAILRGIVPERVVGVADVLCAAGIRIIEVPLNSPDPFASIAALAAGVRPDCLVGAGTVLNIDHVHRTQAAGGQLVVSPNFDAEVINEATRLGLRVLPGIATATEAFGAIRAGATQLKLFPASTYGPRHLQALRTVLPSGVGIFPVGGVTAEQKLKIHPGYQVPFAERIRREAGIPTMAVGLITEPAQAEEIIASGKADLVALARGMLFNPRWPWLAATQLGGKVFYPKQYERSHPSMRGGDFLIPVARK